MGTAAKTSPRIQAIVDPPCKREPELERGPSVVRIIRLARVVQAERHARDCDEQGETHEQRRQQRKWSTARNREAHGMQHMSGRKTDLVERRDAGGDFAMRAKRGSPRPALEDSIKQPGGESGQSHVQRGDALLRTAAERDRHHQRMPEGSVTRRRTEKENEKGEGRREPERPCHSCARVPPAVGRPPSDRSAICAIWKTGPRWRAFPCSAAGAFPFPVRGSPRRR